MHVKQKRSGEKKGKDGEIKNKEPLAEGPSKGLTRRTMLFLTAYGGLVAITGTVFSTVRCGATYKVHGVPDGGMQDGSVDSGDASQLDAEVKDVNVPDSRPDVEVPDTGVDSSVDSSVDSAVDGSVTCPTGTNQEIPGWFRPINNPGVIGTEYEVTYTLYVDSTHLEIGVDCVSTGDPIVTAHQLTLNQEAIIPLGGKNLRVTVTQLNTGAAVMDAAVENP